MARALCSKARRRRTSASCSRNSSSKTSRRRAGSTSSSDSGPWMAPEGRGAVPQVERRPPLVGQRVGELAGPLERLVDERADLPAGQAGLGRRRVDGQDAQGARGGRTGSSTPATTSTTGLTIWRVPRYSPTLPKKMASVPTASCLARQGWLKKTTFRRARVVAHRQLDRRRGPLRARRERTPTAPRPARPPRRRRRAPETSAWRVRSM